MLSLRNVRMKCFEGKSLKEKQSVKSDFYLRLLYDLHYELKLSDLEFHGLCEILADKCSLNIFSGGDIDNLDFYTSLLQCSHHSEISKRAQELKISLIRLKKEAVFPFNISELFINESDFVVKIIHKQSKRILTDEVLTVFYEYWPPCEQHYLDDEELEMYGFPKISGGVVFNFSTFLLVKFEKVFIYI